MCRIFAISAILLLELTALTAENSISLWPYSGRIYSLNGFDKTLTVYDSLLNKVSTADLNIISKEGYFDSFAVYNSFSFYISDSVKGLIWQLDEKYNSVSMLNLNKQNINISGHVFPLKYNTLITASGKKDAVYAIRNGNTYELIKTGDYFYDIWVTNDRIFILYNKKVSIYTSDGVFIQDISLSRSAEKIRVFRENIFTYGGTSVLSVNMISHETREFDTGSLRDFSVYGKSIFYLPKSSNELIRIEF